MNKSNGFLYIYQVSVPGTTQKQLLSRTDDFFWHDDQVVSLTVADCGVFFVLIHLELHLVCDTVDRDIVKNRPESRTSFCLVAMRDFSSALI